MSHRSRPRLQPARFPSSSPSPLTRSGSVLSPASPVRAATQPGSISSSPRWWKRGRAFRTNSVPAAGGWPSPLNPANAATTEAIMRDVETAARAMALQIQTLNASTSGEIQAAFERLVHERPDALFVANEPFFLVRRVHPATLPARHRLPARCPARDPVEAGAVLSSRSHLDPAA